MSFWRLAGLTLVYLWVSPNTLLGLGAAALCRLGGATGRLREGIIEVQGPGIEWVLRALPTRFPIAAITIGHVVLGRDGDSLQRTRAHERVHVEQYQRWGPLFLPAYFAASALAWLRGGDPYRDNAFEREAYAREGLMQSADEETVAKG